MNKVGIITLYGYANYGNRLQNLAVQRLLQKRGFEVETITCRRSRIREMVHPVANTIKRVILHDAKARRVLVFRRFEKRMNTYRIFYSKTLHLPRSLKESYEYFVTGSDQVWNIYFFRKDTFDGELDMYFLRFADDRQKICISPSIGVPRYREEDENTVREALKGFRYLSCREAQGAKELARLSGKPVEQLIDPTLSLTPNEWKEMLPDASGEGRKPYVFLYFLDGMSSELKAFIHTYASGRYDIIDLSDRDSPLYSSDPAQFVSFLSNARMVFTDSFHVVAFSIIFHIPFYVFDRLKMQNINSRIVSITDVTGLQDRYIGEQKEFNIQENCDFARADEQLTIERKRFSDYLDKCFES